jgi:hypothetical protein
MLLHDIRVGPSEVQQIFMRVPATEENKDIVLRVCQRVFENSFFVALISNKNPLRLTYVSHWSASSHTIRHIGKSSSFRCKAYITF